MRPIGRQFLYLLAGAALVTVLSVGVFLIVSPEAASSEDAIELTSPEGRIRIDQVLSYAGPGKGTGIARDLETQAPAAVYVPSYLPEGFLHSHTRLLTKTSVGQLFEAEGNATLMVVQSPGALLTAQTGYVEPVNVNGRWGFLVHGDWTDFKGPATWDPGRRTTLLLEMDDGVVALLAEGNSVTKLELVRMGGSLEPDRDIVAGLLEESAYPQEIADKLPTGFGALHVPSYVPVGYVVEGAEARPEWGHAELRYRKLCALNVTQYAQGSPIGPEIARRATFGPHETKVVNGNQFHIGYRVASRPVSGITFYLSDPHPDRYDEHWFAHEGIWFNIEVDTRPVCESPDIEGVARIAKSLRPAT